MNIESLVGKTVFVKCRNDGYHLVIGGELKKDKEGFYVFVPNNGISSYIQFRQTDIVRIQDFESFYHVTLK